MTVRRPRSALPRKAARWLLAALPLILFLSGTSVHAATSASGHGHASKTKPQVQQVSQQKRKKTTRRRAKAYRAPAPPSRGTQLGLHRTRDELALKSSVALVVDQDSGEVLVAKNPDVVLPIASLTKLMTALVVLDAAQPLDEVLEIGREDVDTHKKTHSRLAVGTRLTRDDLLLLSLMSSENRAAMALSRHYPGGRAAFLARMNAKAWSLGMTATRFTDSAGLSPHSVSTARDLNRLLIAAYSKPLIRRYSTQFDGEVRVGRGRLTFINSNRLVRKQGDWVIGLQKTGFTNEAGRCLMMQAQVLGRRLSMVFLDSTGTLTRYADAARVRRQIERLVPGLPREVGVTGASSAMQASLTSPPPKFRGQVQ